MKDLYNRIRPTNFKEMLVTSPFLKDIDTIIDETIKGNPGLPHIMIFHSPAIPGLGKTTCGRILAVKLNPSIPEYEAKLVFEGERSMICTEVNATDMKKPDISQLMREIMACKHDLYGYKYVFIINEAHKLTEDSAHLLLSLEDMPDNVFVIMTTTETIKMRTDLMSRVRTYNFRPVSDAVLLRYITDIINNYKDEYLYSAKYDLTVDQDRLRDIISMSSGSIRQTIIYLEQLMSTGEVEQHNDASKDELQKSNVFFADFLAMWTDIPSGLVTWSSIAEKLITVTTNRNHRSGMPPEEFRKFLLYRIQGVLVSDRVISNSMSFHESFIYSTLARYLIDPLAYPVTTQLVLKLHMAYMDIINGIAFTDAILVANNLGGQNAKKE